LRYDKKVEPTFFGVKDILMTDEHHLVLKGYGWMLKILSTKEPELIFDYLLKNKAVMPRVAYRYALEKMDAEKSVSSCNRINRQRGLRPQPNCF